MKITFLGAAENVTGSRHLLETGDVRILIDCGLCQEREFLARNWDAFPVDPASLTHVILTHAHLDHCGYLPRLVKAGFSGPVFCTSPTEEIARVVLLDAAKLQEEDVRVKQERHAREGRPDPHPPVPLYTMDDARAAGQYLHPVSYGEDCTVSEAVSFSFRDAGHILGAGTVGLRVVENGKAKSVVFSGDLGRWEQTILCVPQVWRQADAVVMESTYGNRLHGTVEDSLAKVCRVVTQTLERGGNVIIPAFSVERSQELVYFLARFQAEKRIPPTTIFVDSPMAAEVNRIFARYPEYFCGEMKDLLAWGRSPLDSPPVVVTASVGESKAINNHPAPCIIVAGSGMCTGGRVKHHLRRDIARPECTVLFVGYQAQGTLGREILERPRQVRIFGETHPVRARIEKVNGFSSHADRDELLRWFAGFEQPPAQVFVVHGEKETAREFADTLASRTAGQVTVPHYLQGFSL